MKKQQQQNQTKSSASTTSANTATKPTRSTTGNGTGRKQPYNQQQTTTNTMKKQYNQTGNNVSESYNNQSIMPIKKEQMYRMLDKLFHLLNNPVTHESFVSASSLYKEISNYLSLAELKSIGDAWRNLYTEENETGYSNLKTVISSVKSRFA